MAGLHERLRDATRAAHGRVEQALSLTEITGSWQSYTRALQTFEASSLSVWELCKGFAQCPGLAILMH